MKFKTLFLGIIVACISCIVNAQNIQNRKIDVATARRAGLNFFHSISNSPNAKSITDLHLYYTFSANSNNNAKLHIADTTAYIYVFSTYPTQGFIIVSANNGVMPILGYSDKNSFSVQNLPTNIAAWFQRYVTQIQYVIQHAMEPTEEVKSMWQTLLNNNNTESRKPGNNHREMGGINLPDHVHPLLTTKWDQGVNYNNPLCGLYNLNCPPYHDLITNKYSSDSNTVTGCVATATAQVMKYWNYPAKGFSNFTYTDDKGDWKGNVSANFGATTYDWENMPDQLSQNSSLDEIKAVSTLIGQVGVAVKMDYNFDQSSAHAHRIDYSAEYSLKNFFGYDNSLHSIGKSELSDTLYLAILMNELANRRPVIYTGSGKVNGKSEGHCFVFDGYYIELNNVYFDINWGWSGYCDGNFTITNLVPGSNSGTGAGNGIFNDNQGCVIGIQPPANYQHYNLSLYKAISSLPNNGIINYGGSIKLNTNIINNGANSFTGDFCVFISDSSISQIVDSFPIINNSTLPSGNIFSQDLSFTTSGKVSLLPGKYYASLFFRPTGGEWQIVNDDYNNNFFNISQITIINSNAIELNSVMNLSPQSPIIKGDNLFVQLNVKNTSSAAYYGQYQLDLFNLDGTLAQTIGTYNESTGLPGGYTYANPYLNFYNAINVSAGDYYLALEQQPQNGDWQLVGSTYYPNPIKVSVQNPAIQPDKYEVNDSLEIATPLTLSFQKDSAFVSTTGSNFHVGKDVDFYKIVLGKNYAYSVDLNVYDANYAPDGNDYSVPTILYYSTDGENWSAGFQNTIPQNINLNGADTLYVFVGPYFSGFTGNYLLNISVKRTPICVLPKNATITQSVISTNCISSSVQLSLPSASSYSWYLNDTLISAVSDSFYVPLKSGYYKAKISGAMANCSVFTDSVLINVNTQQNKLFALDTIKKCGANFVTLDAGAGYSNYLWNTGETTQTIKATSTGKYAVSAQCGTPTNNTGSVSFLAGATGIIPHSDSLTSQMTLMFWINLHNNIDGSLNKIFYKQSNANTNPDQYDFQIIYDGGLSFQYPSGGSVVGIGTNFDVSNWCHIALVKSKDSLAIYFNGNLSQKIYSPNPLPDNGYNIMFGAPLSTSLYWNSVVNLDDISLWKRALSQAEINYYKSNCISSTSNGLIGYYGLNNIDGNLNLDYSQFHNNGPWLYGGEVSPSPQQSCSANLIADSIFVSLVNSKIVQRDTTICKGDSVTLNIDSTLKNSAINLRGLPKNLQNQLVSYYPFNGNPNDASGNGYNGTVNRATLTTDRFGNANKAYSFTNANGGISVSSFKALGNNFTISYWVNYSTSILNTSIRDLSYDFQNNGIFATYRDFPNSIAFATPGTNGISNNINILSSDSLSLDRWYHITSIRNGNELKLFINGKLVKAGINNFTSTIPSKTLYIGGDPFQVNMSSNAAFSGKLDDIFIYDRSLSDEEVQQIFSTNQNIFWSTGSTLNSITVSPLTTTSYWVSVTDGYQTCTDSVKIAVAAVDTSLGYIGKTNFCTGDSVILFGGLNATSYQWLKNNVPISGAIAQRLIIKESGRYSVIVANTNGCSDTSRSVSVTVNPSPETPIITALGVPTICVGDSVMLKSNYSSRNQWNVNGTIVEGAIGATYEASISGNYTVKTSNINGCFSAESNSVSISVNPLPVGSIQPLPQNYICADSSIILHTNGNYEFQWFNNNKPIIGAIDSSYTALSGGNYTVKYTNSFGCVSMSTNTVKIDLIKKPIADFSFATKCINQPVVFQNISDIKQSGVVNWLWKFGNGNTSNLVSPVYTYTNEATYHISLIAFPNNCPLLVDSISKDILFKQSIAPIAYPPIDVKSLSPVQLQARKIGLAYNWIPSNGLNNAAIINPIATVTNDQLYKIVITDSLGCMVVDSQLLRVYNNYNVFVPNGFSPDFDHVNDVLRPILIGIKKVNYFRIFNRWGQKIFETNEINAGWDGNYLGKQQPPETYIWTVEVVDLNGKIISKSGKSTLIR